MLREIFKRDSIPQRKNVRDVFAVCDIAGFASLADAVPATNYMRTTTTATHAWSGNKDFSASIEQVKNGDLAGVAASDKLLEKIETDMHPTMAWKVISDVVGGVPNVAAAVAGHPLTMRRRQRVQSEMAPLTVFLSLTSSAGIENEQLQRRGACVLALVRMLAARRPVALYACVSTGFVGVAGHVMTRIDTSPLDLARAAHLLTCTSVSRGLGYGIVSELIRDHLHHKHNDQFEVAYGWPPEGQAFETMRIHGREIYAQAVAVNPADCIFVPPIRLHDEFANPVKWLEKMLHEYGGVSVTDAA